MRVTVHADDIFNPPDFLSGPKRPYQNGVYVTRATVEPDDGEPYQIKWVLEMRDGDLLYSWPDSPAGPLENVSPPTMLRS